MARAIDADALQELCNRRIQDTWNSGVAPVSWAEAYADFKDDIDSIPTLTPPNEPLTLEQLAKAWQGAMQLLYNMPTLTPPNEPEYRGYTCKNCWHTWLEDRDASDYPEYCPGCGVPLHKEENEPLTIEQLRQMDGEPVYIIIDGVDQLKMWVLVEIDGADIYLTNNLGGRSSYEEIRQLYKFKLYRRPPEGE